MLCVTLIAAVSEDGFISRGSGVPWHLPADIAQFRQATAGKWLLLGRRTYEEMTGWFQSDHSPIVLTHTALLHGPGRAIGSMEKALELAADQAELMVCGGGQVYAMAIPYASKIWLTRVHTQLLSGVSFPTMVPSEWHIVSCRHHPADESHAHAMDFICMERKTKTRE